jgi:hypothetical protein
LTEARQLGKRALPRCIAVACILIALLFAGLEATHIHGAARSGNAGSPCAVCISAHANAPLAAPQSIPVILTSALLVVPYDVDVKGVPVELTLFIRPPPTV